MIFTPEQTSLPQEYSKFSSIDGFHEKLNSIRKKEFPNNVYDKLWIGLCMAIDRKSQKSFANNLKRKLKDSRGKTWEEDTAAYWKDMNKESAYPMYLKMRNEIRYSGFARKIVSQWKRNEKVTKYLSKRDDHRVDWETAEKIYPNLFGGKVLGRVGRDVDVYSSGRNNMLEYLKKEGKPELVGYVLALKFQVTARSMIHELLTSEIKQLSASYKGTLIMDIPDVKEKIGRILKRTEILKEFDMELSGALNLEEYKLFGEENRETASFLWRATVFFRSIGQSLKKIREPILDVLVKGDYSTAYNLMREIVSKHPDILSDFHKAYLHVDPVKPVRRMQSHRERREKRIGDIIKGRRIIDLNLGKQIILPDGTVIVLKRTGRWKDQYTPGYYLEIEKKGETKVNAGPISFENALKLVKNSL